MVVFVCGLASIAAAILIANLIAGPEPKIADPADEKWWWSIK